ncbi:MAG: hypothetical protein ACLP8S_12265 [Solirubrobacteraceae bacterium]
MTEPVHDRDGRILGVSTITRDTTERKQAATALLEAQDRFRCAFEDSPVGMVILDLEARYATAIASSPNSRTFSTRRCPRRRQR